MLILDYVRKRYVNLRKRNGTRTKLINILITIMSYDESNVCQNNTMQTNSKK